MDMKPVVCPECGAQIIAPEDLSQGEIITCQDCGLELEVKEVKADFIAVEELQLEGEDWGE